MNKLDKVNYRLYPVLPSVYDDTISFYELLGKMNGILNDAVDDINEIIDTIQPVTEFVLSVCGITADENRNVPLTPANLGAIAKDGSVANVYNAATFDLNNFKSGVVLAGTACTNIPNTTDWWLVISGGDGTNAKQVAFPMFDNSTSKERRLLNGVWTNWVNYPALPAAATTGTISNANENVTVNSIKTVRDGNTVMIAVDINVITSTVTHGTKLFNVSGIPKPAFLPPTVAVRAASNNKVGEIKLQTDGSGNLEAVCNGALETGNYYQGTGIYFTND